MKIYMVRVNMARDSTRYLVFKDLNAAKTEIVSWSNTMSFLQQTFTFFIECLLLDEDGQFKRDLSYTSVGTGGYKQNLTEEEIKNYG